MSTIFDVPVITRLSALLQDVRKGKILIPQFQRPFVWKDDQRLALMDSIHKQMPIGSLLVWRTQTHKLETYKKLGPFSLAIADEKKGTRTYLLDGHQRLSTLYGALNPPEAPEASESNRDGEEERSWPIYYDLDPPQADRQRDLRFRLCSRSKQTPPPTWLPLSSLFDPVRLYEFQKKLIDDGRPELSREAEKLANAFKDYAVPVVPIATDDLDRVTDSFQRVNSQGTPMNEVHMLSALLYPKKLRLTQRFAQIAANLEEVGWKSLDHQVLLNTLKVGWDLHVYSSDTKHVREELEKKPERLDELQKNLEVAIDFLAKHCGVHGPGILPSTYQLVALAEAARIHHGRPFDTRVADDLRRWFWATSYTRYFSGMTGNQIQQAIEHVRDIVLHKAASPCPPELQDTEIEPIDRFDFSWTRSRAFVLLLAQLRPRTAEGQELEISSLLADQGSATVSKIFAEEPANVPENRWLVPPSHLKALRELVSQPAQMTLWPEQSTEVLLSHGIDDQARRALETGDRQAFLDARRAYLEKREREFLEELALPLRWPSESDEPSD